MADKSETKDEKLPEPSKIQGPYRRRALMNKLRAKSKDPEIKELVEAVKNEEQATHEIKMDEIHKRVMGARTEMERLARHGLDKQYGQGEIHADVRLVARYRACQALGWDDAEILGATGWSTNKLRQIRDAARQFAGAVDLDAAENWATFRAQQLLVIRQLDETIQEAITHFNIPAAMTGLKTKAEIFNKIFTMGQDLGLLAKASREIKIEKTVKHVEEYDPVKIREEIKTVMADMDRMLGQMSDIHETPAGAVLRRVLPSRAKDTESK